MTGVKMQILSTLGSVLFEDNSVSIKETLENAVKQNADLQYANLQYANLQYANLQYTNLYNANLQYADLRYANLQYANLRYANLQNANLQNADLYNANLQNADLQYANLYNANLQYANLYNAKLNFTSHNLLAEILKRAALDDVKHRKIAGLVLISTDWCWDKFISLKDPSMKWALTELAKMIVLEDNHPEILDKYISV
jgi:uncharacterized protein YjbI with pentapeptide repeats